MVCNDGPIGRDLLGVCLPKPLVEYAKAIVVLRQYLRERWDCGVAYAQKTCSMEHSFPAYFTYLIAHELGHAKVCMTDLRLHIHSCLVQEHILEASDKEISRWDQLPHEVRIDQYAIYVMLKFFSREQFNREVNVLIGEGCSDLERMEKLLDWAPCEHFVGLRDELIKVTLPYKKELIEIIEREAAKSTEEQPLIEKLVYDPEQIWQ